MLANVVPLAPTECRLCGGLVRWSDLIRGFTHVGPFLSPTVPLHTAQPERGAPMVTWVADHLERQTMPLLDRLGAVTRSLGLPVPG